MNSDKGVRVGLLLRMDPRFWSAHVIAIDKKGVHYQTMGGESRKVGDFMLLGYLNFQPIPDPQVEFIGRTEAEPKLSLADVKEFRAEVQPVDFVEFHNIALEPSEPMPAPARK